MTSPDTPQLHLAAGTEGPAILLLHGFGSDRLSWLANSSQLGAAGRVYTLDLPGHGETPLGAAGHVSEFADAAARALDASGLSKVHLVGHSLGGAVALQLAAARPDVVRSLALIAAAGLGQGVDAGFLAEFPRAETPEEIDALLKRLVSRPRLVNRFMVAHVLEQLQRPGARQALVAVAKSLAVVASEIEPEFQAVAGSALPRLTIWGEADSISPLDRERLARFGGETLILAEAAHLPHVEFARLVNERLVAWFAAQA